MSGRYTKSIPEFVYFIGDSGWIEGPFVHPKSGRINRKFKLTEIIDTEQKCPYGKRMEKQCTIASSSSCGCSDKCGKMKKELISS
jgi:hypothetical protein